MPDVNIVESLEDARNRLRTALTNAGRDPASAHLLAVSKTQPAASVRQAFEAGQREFGENYVQEALDKQAALADLDAIVWHFIGPLQSNKTRAVAEHFQWVHTLDRERIARRLAAQRPPALGPLDVCLQVNVSGEASKSGVAGGSAGTGRRGGHAPPAAAARSDDTARAERRAGNATTSFRRVARAARITPPATPPGAIGYPVDGHERRPGSRRPRRGHLGTPGHGHFRPACAARLTALSPTVSRRRDIQEIP